MRVKSVKKRERLYISNFKLLAAITSIVLMSVFAFADKDATRYNESTDEKGQLRPIYQQFEQQTGYSYRDVNEGRNPSVVYRFMPSIRPFGALGDKLRILPTPLLVSESDQTFINEGSRQRIRALKAFFHDMAIGEQKGLKSGLIRHDLLDFALARSGFKLETLRQTWAGKSEKDIHFLAGIDIVRRPDGQFVVLEDNVGNIGGLVDKDAVLNEFGEFLNRRLRPGDHPYDLREFVTALNHSTQEKPRWMLAIIDENDRHDKGTFDLEDSRIKAELDEMKYINLDVVFTSSKNAQDIFERTVAERGGSLPTSVFNWSATFYTEELFKHYSWIFNQVFKKLNVPLLNAPGVQMLGNKVWLPFVEKMIEFYLNEKPILKTQDTLIVENGWAPPDDNWVLKSADGAGGKDVYILPKLDAAARADLNNDIEIINNMSQFVTPHSYFVAQPLVPISKIKTVQNERMQVDIRPILFAGGDHGVMLGKTYFGRASWIFGNGLNNTTSGAFEIPVVNMGGENTATLEPLWQTTAQGQDCWAALKKKRDSK